MVSWDRLCCFLSGFVRRQVGGQMSQLGKVFNSNFSQMFKKDAKWRNSTQHDDTIEQKFYIFFSLQIYSRVSRVMRAITGFITTHLPGVAAPAPLIHNLKRSQKIFQGGLYRIHLMWQNKNGDLVAGKDCSTVCEEHLVGKSRFCT